MPELVRIRSLARRSRTRAEQQARDLRLLPGEPGPLGRIDSFADWVENTGLRGAALVALPEGEPGDPRRPAKTVQGLSHPKLEAVQRLPIRRRATITAAIPHGRLATGFGLVIGPDNRVFAETAWDDEQLEVSRLLRLRRLPPARRVAGVHASLVAQWDHNYSHWLLEVLPRLGLLAEAGFHDAGLIVSPRPTRFQRESLELLGIPEERQTAFHGLHLQPDVLVWAQPPDHAGNPSAWTCGWLRDRLVPAVAPASSLRRRLYISRSGIARPTKRRNVANEANVLALLEPLGFEVVRPEELSLAAQVRRFAEAEAVVGPHGAALTNLVFSNRVHVLELFEKTFVHPTYYCLASSAGHDYWYLIGEKARRGDIDVPLDRLHETLELMLAA